MTVLGFRLQASGFRTTTHAPPPRLTPHASRLTPSRGISLLEILISMFVLMIGLMGVASLFPVGGFYLAKGERYDRGAVMSEQAFDELRTRGMLRPQFWSYGGLPPVPQEHAGLPFAFMQHDDDGDPFPGRFNLEDLTLPPAVVGRAFVLDPMGAADPILVGDNRAGAFPYWDLERGNVSALPINDSMPLEWRGDLSTTPVGLPELDWPIRRLTLLDAIGPMTKGTAETIFRLRDDLAVEQPAEDDHPAMQRWDTADPNNTPQLLSDDIPLARQYQGNYSWLATIVPITTSGIKALQPADSGYGSTFYEVSVAVMHKRDETVDPVLAEENEERTIRAEMNLGRELVLFHDDPDMVDAAVEDLNSGEWIAVAGVNQTNGAFLLKWYRVLSIDEKTEQDVNATLSAGNINPPSTAYIRRLALDGPDWPLNSMQNLRAIILPGVVTVTTQGLTMEAGYRLSAAIGTAAGPPPRR